MKETKVYETHLAYWLNPTERLLHFFLVLMIRGALVLEVWRKKDLELSTVELKKKGHGEHESRHLGDLVTTRGKQPNRKR